MTDSSLAAKKISTFIADPKKHYLELCHKEEFKDISIFNKNAIPLGVFNDYIIWKIN